MTDLVRYFDEGSKDRRRSPRPPIPRHSTGNKSPLSKSCPSIYKRNGFPLGSSYKLQHKISFPPFEVFVDFIRQQALIRNNPSFKCIGLAEVPPKADKTLGYQTDRRKYLSTKTDILRTAPPDDHERLCPIHKMPHLLQKCRAFREKPLEERKGIPEREWDLL
ncbi:hypothetical protein N1851_015866 [Merluccius polli]|uniref:Uncharacterized protein n=1 Tax=Merluccius polli TaxID=89951 RepID=A0AA47MRM5_MERPO|nr:hypothetical protein N1851_015866 [Merluccius polli]